MSNKIKKSTENVITSTTIMASDKVTWIATFNATSTATRIATKNPILNVTYNAINRELQNVR